jgi:hypothetical protein
MQQLMERLYDFYILDQSTVMLMALFCGWAALYVRSRVANIAFLIFLYPLFILIGATVLCYAIHMEVIAIKRASDWIMYTATASGIGAITGITMVALWRQLVDLVTLRSHIRTSVRRDEENASKGYERLQL